MGSKISDRTMNAGYSTTCFDMHPAIYGKYTVYRSKQMWTSVRSILRDIFRLTLLFPTHTVRFAFKEFGYNEHPLITRIFFLIFFARCKRDWIFPNLIRRFFVCEWHTSEMESLEYLLKGVLLLKRLRPNSKAVNCSTSFNTGYIVSKLTRRIWTAKLPEN